MSDLADFVDIKPAADELAPATGATPKASDDDQKKVTRPTTSPPPPPTSKAPATTVDDSSSFLLNEDLDGFTSVTQQQSNTTTSEFDFLSGLQGPPATTTTAPSQPAFDNMLLDNNKSSSLLSESPLPNVAESAMASSVSAVPASAVSDLLGGMNDELDLLPSLAATQAASPPPSTTTSDSQSSAVPPAAAYGSIVDDVPLKHDFEPLELTSEPKLLRDDTASTKTSSPSPTAGQLKDLDEPAPVKHSFEPLELKSEPRLAREDTASTRTSSPSPTSGQAKGLDDDDDEDDGLLGTEPPVFLTQSIYIPSDKPVESVVEQQPSELSSLIAQNVPEVAPQSVLGSGEWQPESEQEASKDAANYNTTQTSTQLPSAIVSSFASEPSPPTPSPPPPTSTSKPREPSPPPQPIPPPQPDSTTAAAKKEPVVEEVVKKETIVKKEEAKKEVVVKAPEKKTTYPSAANMSTQTTVSELVHWRDPKKSGIVFGLGLVVLFSLACCSIISVVSYTALLALSATLSFRVYKSVLQAVQKTNDGHPFKEYLDIDVTPSSERVHQVADLVIQHANPALRKLRSIFLVEDIVDSIKFVVLFWILTYVGSWFNGLTLIILAYLGAFSLPKAYEMNKAQVDQVLELACKQVQEVVANVKAALPFPSQKKEKGQ